MNIVEKLNAQNIRINIIYYGLDDLSTGITVKDLLDGKDIILSHYSTTSIDTFNDYIDYVFMDFIMNFDEVIPYIKEDKKQEFLEFYQKCELIYRNYKIKDIVKFLKTNYENIYNYKDDKNKSIYLANDLKNYTSDFIASKFNSFGIETIEYIINNSTYNIIDSFNKWQKFFIKNPNNLSKLLNEENINKVIYMRFKELTDIIESLSTNEKFSATILNAVEIIYNIIKDKYFNPVGEHAIWQSYFMINDSLLFFKKMKSSHVYELEKELEKQEVIFNENLVQNGHVQTIEYNLKPFIDFFEDKNKPWEIRIFYLTHSKDDKGNLVSFLEHGAKCKEKAFTDDLTRNNPGTDKYFTNWRLRNLDLYIFEIKARFMSLMNKTENISEYLSDIYGELKYICKNIDTSIELESLDENMEMLAQFLTDLFVNLRKENDLTKWSIKNNIYGCSMLICGLIEKVLRLIYKHSMKDISYIPDSKITLGCLLNDTNPSIILDILGKEQIKCLRYYLHRIDHYDSVGQNVRNDLAHLNGRTMKRLNYDLILELLAYFTSILNSCILYYQRKSKK